MASADLPILLDTHVIVWLATNDPRIERIDRSALADPARTLSVSAVTAYELADLQRRGRLAMTESLDVLGEHMDFDIIALPADCWKIAANLPPIHRDPVDRMLVAHALAGGFTLATADANIRKYSVPVI